MAATTVTPSAEAAPRQSLFQPQDIAWTLFVAILLLTAPERNNDALILLPLIGAFQIIEPRILLFSSPRGQIASVALKLLLCYLLIGFSDAIYTYYYPIFLIPVVSAATIFDLPGVMLVIALAIAGYFSFLLPVFGLLQHMPSDYLSVMSLRASFYLIIGFLVYQQARAKRNEMARTKEALERLVESNRNLRVAEASLRRTERLAALGQLTAGLAHELRNPLGTMKASAEMLARQVEQGRPEIASEMAGYISAEVDRINGLVASFLDFARPLRMKAAIGELRPVIESAVRQQSDLAQRSGVTVTTQFDNPDLRFAFDPDLLSVAISNLVQNAIQASTSGQEVLIRVSPQQDLARILVTDHGVGITPEHLESIFNPFFTTKPEGVGLGLALVSKIVDEHNGRINVFSEPGRGTTFEITLPMEQPS